MDDDGILDTDMMLTMLPEAVQSKAEPVLNNCKDVRKYLRMIPLIDKPQTGDRQPLIGSASICRWG